MKRQFVHLQNKKRSMPSDFDRISEVQSILSELGYNSLRGQVLLNPNFLARGRHPDLLIKLNGEEIPVELDGLVHGNGDEITESQQTSLRNDDYIRAGYFPIILNESWLKNEKIGIKEYLKFVLFNLEQVIRAKRRLT